MLPLVASPDTHRITVVGEGREASFDCGEQTTLLSAALVNRGGAIAAGCRGGGCGVCRIVIRSGKHQSAAMSRTHVTVADEAEGVALACRVWPRSDLVIETVRRRQSWLGQPRTDSQGSHTSTEGESRWES
jgi:ferredoxin